MEANELMEYLLSTSEVRSLSAINGSSTFDCLANSPNDDIETDHVRARDKFQKKKSNQINFLTLLGFPRKVKIS